MGYGKFSSVATVKANRASPGRSKIPLALRHVNAEITGVLGYWSIGSVAVLGIGLILFSINSQPSPPVYAGKTVDQWLDAGYEDAATALHEIGPSAVPYILGKLRREDSRCGSLQRFRQLFNRLPANLRAILPKPKVGNFDEMRACSDLLELGPQAIPLLTAELHHPTPVVREVSAHALGLFRRQGKNITQSVPFLIKAERDPNLEVRARAAWALEGALITISAKGPTLSPAPPN